MLVAITAADAFRRNAHSFLLKMPNNLNTADVYAANNFGGLIASATNQALAVELYLKSLRIVLGLSVPMTHHLWSLYKELPSEIKQSFERDYDKNNKKGNDVAAIELAFKPPGADSDEFQRWQQQSKIANFDDSLKSILEQSSDAFQTWRYIYEVQPGEKFGVIRYEFRRLDLIAHLARAYAAYVIKKTAAIEVPAWQFDPSVKT